MLLKKEKESKIVAAPLSVLQSGEMSSDWDISNKIVFLFLCAIAMVSSYGLAWDYVYVGHDFWYHIQRIESLYQQLRRGILYSPVNYYFFEGYGYASSVGYPDIFLYIPALLRFFFSSSHSYNIFIVFCILISVLTSYISALSVFNKKWVALVFTLLFSLALYKFVNLHFRSALGEFLGLIFMPMAFAGVYDLVFRDAKKKWLLILGFTGLCYTHVITTYLVFVFSLIICIPNYKKVLKHWKEVVYCATLIIGLSALFVIPCMELYFFQDIKAHYPHKFTVNTALSLERFFKFGDRLGGYQLVIVLLITISLSFLPKGNNNNLSKVYYSSLILAIFSLFCISTYFPWGTNPLLNSVQFPWRIYGCASFFVSMAFAALIMLVNGKLHSVRLIIATFVLLFSLSSLFVWNHINQFPAKKIYDIQNTNTLIGDWLEFSPKQFSKKFAIKTKDQCISDDGSYFHCVKNWGEVSFILGNQTDYVDIPLTYYIGYQASTKDKNTLLSVVESPNGTCRVITKGLKLGSQINVNYEGTWAQKIGQSLTLITILSIILFCFLKKQKFVPRELSSSEIILKTETNQKEENVL